jgi:hypothetical protein
VFVEWTHDLNCVYEYGQRWLEDQGFDIVGVGETKDGFILISSTFKPLK